jgi:hypothetical protein
MITIEDNRESFNKDLPIPTRLLGLRDLENRENHPSNTASIVYGYNRQTRLPCCSEFLDSTKFLLTKEIVTLTVLGVATSIITIGINEGIREPSKVEQVATTISTLLSLAFFGTALFRLVRRAFDSESRPIAIRV